jgi:SNF2 family DNA or RNA helicase
MQSVTTGIDLTCFDSIIMVGLDWLPSTLRQAEDRIHRIGQNFPVTIYYLIGTGTLDEVVRERVINRLEVSGKLLGDGDSDMITDLSGGSEDDLINAIADGWLNGN